MSYQIGRHMPQSLESQRGQDRLIPQKKRLAADNDATVGSGPATGGRFCSRCAALDLDKIVAALSSPIVDPFSRTGTILLRDARPKWIMSIGLVLDDHENSACPACRFFAACRPIAGNSQTKDFSLWSMPWPPRHLRSDDVPNCTPLLVVSYGLPRMYWTLSGAHHDPWGRCTGFLLPLEPISRISGICARRRLDYVDFDYLRSLISHCEEQHDACKRTVSSDTFALPVTVIDCETYKLHTISPNTKYAALSYVWGSTLQHNDRHSDGPLLDAPPPLEDAMVATKSLGLRYLWVDQYCIAQSDLRIKHEQIRRMDLIYGNAEVTLVALVDDPSCGLPGVSVPRRTSQPCLRVRDKDVLGSMLPAHSIRTSKWWTRAWTLQEAVLSRRRVYFTSEQAYYECRLARHCETISFTPTSEDIRPRPSGPWEDSIVDLDRDLSLDHLRRLLGTYYTRDLTYETDTVNAFLGILQRYSQAPEPVKHYFGVAFTDNERQCPPLNESERKEDEPMANSFICGLSWSASNLTRRPDFPSWSWAGWRGDDFYPVVHHRLFDTHCAFLKNSNSNAKIWFERLDGKVQSLPSFWEDGGFDLPLSEQSRVLWIEGYAANAKVLSLPVLGSITKRHSVALAIATCTRWDSIDSEACYQIMDVRQLPKKEELESYSDLIVLKLGESRYNNYYVLLVGSRDGNQERIGFLHLDKKSRPPSYWKRYYRLDAEPKTIDDVQWKKQMVRLG